MIDLTSLDHALLVLENGSFRRAAGVLGIRPSVVSRRVRALEDAIGVSLFQRQSRGVQPTIAGQRLLQQGRLILDDLNDLLRKAALSSSGTEGRLTVGVVSSIAGGNARYLLRAFLAANVGVELDVVEGSLRDHVSAVSALRMDVTFLFGTPFAPHCEVEPLWSEQIVVVLPASHRLATFDEIALGQLADDRFIVSRVDPGPEVENFILKRLSELGRRPLVERQSVQREGLMALVGLGRGISLMCASGAQVIYPEVIFRRLKGELLPFNAVWSSRNDNPVLRRFLSLARMQKRALPFLPQAAHHETTPPSGASWQNRDPSP